MNKTPKQLLKPIYIYDRETGELIKTIDNIVQYNYVYMKMLEQPNIKKGLEVYADISSQTIKGVLSEFNLVELINCFSINCFAKTDGRKKRIEVK